MDFATDAEVLMPPMPNTSSDLKPDDPSIARRAEVLARVETGSLTPIEAADELGISLNWAHKLLANRHNNRGDPAVHRQAMLARLDTDEARALYAKRKISVEPVFGNIKANLAVSTLQRSWHEGSEQRMAVHLCDSQPHEASDNEVGGGLSRPRTSFNRNRRSPAREPLAPSLRRHSCDSLERVGYRLSLNGSVGLDRSRRILWRSSAPRREGSVESMKSMSASTTCSGASV